MALATAHQPAAHAPAHNHLAINRAGLWLFFFSETILFGLLLSARFYLEGIHREELNQLLGLGITIVLLLSSVTAYTAETAIEHDNKKVGSWYLFFTILLGLIFAGGVAFEWSTAHFHRYESFGSVFFTMTGIHATHVITGVVMLILVWIQALRGRYSSKNPWAVSAVVMYWHFVDVVWVFYYPALYLTK
jgi:cytochrome c oxidase subunit 3